MIIKPTNEVLLLGWESVAENQEKGFLDENLKLTLQTYDKYIDEIHRILGGMTKLLKGV